MRNFITHEWFTLLTIIGLMAIVLAKFSNALRFNDFLWVVGNSKYLKIYTRDQKFIDQFDSLLFINLVISGSIFVHFAYSTFILPLSFNLIDFLKILFAISTIIIIKVLIERLVGSLFEMDSLIDQYLFQKTAFKNYSGFLFVAANVILLYTELSKTHVIIVALSLIGLINLIGFLATFKSHQKLISVNLFYFLLYLCALEIAPYVLLYKVISEYNA